MTEETVGDLVSWLEANPGKHLMSFAGLSFEVEHRGTFQLGDNGWKEQS